MLYPTVLFYVYLILSVNYFLHFKSHAILFKYNTIYCISLMPMHKLPVIIVVKYPPHS